ncbi:hypothetical protein [Bradyrhizobium sp. SK17]|jgi:hypothetical protein|uniref:hypothetical protein n=1 Tax=Bradyrhizobium sp. SK17 TaxID=2057741 RepID=UPI0012FD1D24|nr:hypothetical protein [Bradyrhizobium sp. SK17]
MLQFFCWATLTAVLLSLKPVLGSLEDMLRPFGWTGTGAFVLICASGLLICYLVAARIDRANDPFRPH